VKDLNFVKQKGAMMGNEEMLGYRLRIEVDRTIADFLFTSPLSVLSTVLLQCRRPWDGEQFTRTRGRSVGLEWSTMSRQIYHPLCIDASFLAFDPVDKRPLFTGDIRSYRIPIETADAECISADHIFKTEAFQRGLSTISKRLADWTDSDLDLARVLTIFAGQMPYHPFWKIKSPGGQKLAVR
jgi:hypothetical protein